MKIMFCPINYDENSKLIDYCVDVFGLSKNKAKKYLTKNQKNLKIKGELELSLNLVNDSLINPCYQGPSINIVYEDEIFLVLDKPANIHCHPLSYLESDNCLSFIRENNLAKLTVNHKDYNRGLLNRLDYATSGILIYVKDQNAYDELRENFHSLVKYKYYQAVVSGKCEYRGTLEDYIAPFEKDKMQVAESGHLAILEIINGEYDKDEDSTQLKINLKSGHRHQIRLQLASRGHPILGDTLYSENKKNTDLLLRATHYALEYKGKTYNFKVG